MRNIFLKIYSFLFILLFVCNFSFADSVYIVQKGDTLYSLSKKYEITVNELRVANNLSENDVLKVGQKLQIPSANILNAVTLTQKKSDSVQKTEKSKVDSQKYKVQKGDTLYALSKKYEISVADLMSLNQMDSSSTLKIGKEILVPQKKTENISKKENIKSQEKNQKEEKNSSSKSENAQISSKNVVWPLSNPKVKNISGKVSGVLLTGKDNESVKIVREGTVMYTGVYRGFGEVVFIQSKTGGLIYSYSGLEKVSVNKGDYLLSGSEIGITGKGKESSIKFMVFKNGKPIDPATAPRG